MKGDTEINDPESQQQLLSLPFTPTTLVWENINYRVNIRTGPPFIGKTTEKVILTNVNGYVKPGTLMAIMGSTGAGKSTLLDILAGRNKAGVLEGKITANNVPIGELPYKKICGYVTQDDCLFTFQTVRETFNFVANMKLPSEFTQAQRAQRVQEVIDDLRLTLVSESYNGSQFVRGISGGEKKRVSIGVELVTNPGLLFLDEPTSGLDSFNAHSVMDRIKTLANNNRSVVCTIHQPRTDIFEMFDSLMLLSRGKVVYFGPAVGVTAYLSGLNFHCPMNVNTADFLMDTIVLNEKAATNSEENYVNLRQVWEEGSNQVAVISSLQDLRTQYQPVFKHSGGQVSWFWELLWLCRRQLFNFARTPATTYVSLAQCVFMALLIGSLFFNIGLDQPSIQNREGVLFFILTNQAFSMMSSLNQFLGERQIFQRERASGTYGVTSYFMSKCLVEAPLVLTYPFVFGSISYWLIGFQFSAVKFLEFQLTLVLFVACAGSLFNFVGSVAPSLVVATVIAPISIITLYLFGGYFINATSIPVYYNWFKYLSFFYYGFRAMCTVEFTGLVFNPCEPNDPGCVGAGVPNGSVVLAGLGMSDVNFWVCIAVLVAMIFAYRLMALTAMIILHKEVK